MRTDDLVEALSADAGNAGQCVERRFGLFEAGGIAIAGLIFLAAWGLRADWAQAVGSPWFLVKLAIVALFAILALPLACALARPGAQVPFRRLSLAGVVLAGAIAADLLMLGADGWRARMVGANSLTCLASIPLLALAPLLAALAGLRHGASVSPALTGFAAGLASGALGALLYAIFCNDDSPLFVALWYSLAIVGVAALGAVLGRFILRW